MSRVPTAWTRTRQRAFVPIALGAVLALALAGCGRSSSGGGGGGGGSSTPPASASASSSAAAGPGDFGTLSKICGPGTPSGPTARGLTNTEIRIGVTADPGAAAAPGLEQEFFDTADGFCQVVQRGGWHQRPQDRHRQVGREAVQRRPGHDQCLPEGLHARRQRQRFRQRRRQGACRLQARPDPGLRRLAASGDGALPGRRRLRSRRRRSTTAAPAAGRDLPRHQDRRRRHRQQHAGLHRTGRAFEPPEYLQGHRHQGRGAPGAAAAGRQLPALHGAVEGGRRARRTTGSPPRTRARSCRR